MFVWSSVLCVCVLSGYPAGGQTRDCSVSVRSLRLSCRRSNTRLFCVCALSLRLSCRRSNTRRWPYIGLLLAHCLQRLANISPVFSYRVLFDVTLNLGQRHRRRANIKPALVQSIVTVPQTCRYLFYVCGLWSSRQARSGRTVLVQCWPTVCGAGSALYRHWVDVILFVVLTMGAIAQ